LAGVVADLARAHQRAADVVLALGRADVFGAADFSDHAGALVERHRIGVSEEGDDVRVAEEGFRAIITIEAGELAVILEDRPQMDTIARHQAGCLLDLVDAAERREFVEQEQARYALEATIW